MPLSELLDLGTEAEQLGETIPCRDYDAELWFAERPEDVEFAKTLCGLCPARTQCLAGALERQEPWGVWGGQLLVQGAVVARKRPRGRPRKHPVAARACVTAHDPDTTGPRYQPIPQIRRSP